MAAEYRPITEGNRLSKVTPSLSTNELKELNGIGGICPKIKDADEINIARRKPFATH